ncbi:hypothetical protein K493DRAFT_310400 [Basidiobolus meristosporus CBS 931.73]|uniref:Uncharacterized protein n=1 Tax=Basidiobolus meristosporus CBS 931.73 TaxID=1314790 RepID=A0A1Y1Z948_9FUNG|nr:hypothetical protein K493DRAFT_310400 [Basidiobolus meristosporus CBS 931.73]|eukprot:ORY06800.1 hypothetical protein K493DRAFT_310400 [Basidiobolus meristosporus CBS 931.73]
MGRVFTTVAGLTLAAGTVYYIQKRTARNPRNIDQLVSQAKQTWDESLTKLDNLDDVQAKQPPSTLSLIQNEVTYFTKQFVPDMKNSWNQGVSRLAQRANSVDVDLKSLWK